MKRVWFALAALFGWAAHQRRELQQRPPSVDSGEICRTCFRELDVAECYETIEHLRNTSEMGELGGTYMTAYWCEEHQPADAVPFRP